MLAETAMIVGITCGGNLKRAEGREGMSFDSDTRTVLIDTRPLPIAFSESMEAALALDFATVPEVSSVFVQNVDGAFLVWIGVENPSRAARRRIYDKQLAMIAGFPTLEFDFNLVLTANRDPKGIVSGEAKLVYSRQ